MLIDCLTSRHVDLEDEYNTKRAEFQSPDLEFWKQATGRQWSIRPTLFFGIGFDRFKRPFEIMKLLFPNLILQSRTRFALFSSTVCGMDSSCEDAILRSSCISLSLLEQRKWWAWVSCRSTSLRTIHKQSEITFYQQTFLATLAFMCDVAVADNEEVVRAISVTAKRSLVFFCQGSCGWTEPFRVPVPEEAWMFPHAQETALESSGGVCGWSRDGGGAAALSTSFPHSEQAGKKMARFRRLDLFITRASAVRCPYSG